MRHRRTPLVAALALAAALPAAHAATYVWTGGSFVSGTTAPNPLAAGDQLTISGGSAKSFTALAFTNEGTVLWAGGGLSLANAATVTNAGLWELQADLSVSQTGSVTGTFTNDGTLRKSGGTGTSTFGTGATSAIAFVNRGTIDAQTGTLRFNGANRFESGTQFTGAGVVTVASASSFAGAIASQNLLLATTSATLLTGEDALLSGTTTWTGGALAGQWTLAAGSTLTGASTSATGNKAITGALTNDGNLLLTEATGVGMREGATLLNRGFVELRGNLGFSQGSGAQAAIVNEGTIAKTAGTGTSTIGSGATSALAFTNRGTVDAQAGTLQLNGANRFETGTRFTGAGVVEVASASSFAGSIQSQNLLLSASASTVMEGSAAQLQGQVRWDGGRLQGQWTFGSGSTLQAIGGSATGNKVIAGAGTVLTNEGLLTLNSATGIGLNDGATLVNRGTIDLQVNRGIARNSGAAVTFTNEGLLVKSGGTGTSTVGGADASFSLVNTGRIEVQTGTLRLTNAFANDGALSGNGTLQSSGILAQRGTLSPGVGGTGTLSIAGVSLQMDAGSRFEVDLGAGGTHDLLAVTGGTAFLAGTLALNCLGACQFAEGDRITVLDATSVVGTFAGLSTSGFGSGAFEIVYDLPGSRVQLLVTQAVSPVPEPGGWALLLAGGAVVAGVVRRRMARG